MLTTYDLYDLSAVYKVIQDIPKNPQNVSVMEAVLYVIQNRRLSPEDNVFRRKLQTITNLPAEFNFTQTINVYVHTPYICEEEEVYRLLEAITQYFLQALRIGDAALVKALAECLYNLPIDIAKSHGVVPKTFWRNEVKQFRNEWDKTFLKDPDQH